MERYRKNYKKSTDHAVLRQKRITGMAKDRKEKRERNFGAFRAVAEDENSQNLENINATVAEDNCKKEEVDMKEKLNKWKKEREKQRLEELQKKNKTRPPFKTGVARVDALQKIHLSDKFSLEFASKMSSGQVFQFGGAKGPTLEQGHGAVHLDSTALKPQDVSTAVTSGVKGRGKIKMPLVAKQPTTPLLRTLRSRTIPVVQLQRQERKPVKALPATTVSAAKSEKTAPAMKTTVTKVPPKKGLGTPQVQHEIPAPSASRSATMSNKSIPGSSRTRGTRQAAPRSNANVATSPPPVLEKVSPQKKVRSVAKPASAKQVTLTRHAPKPTSTISVPTPSSSVSKVPPESPVRLSSNLSVSDPVSALKSPAARRSLIPVPSPLLTAPKIPSKSPAKSTTRRKSYSETPGLSPSKRMKKVNVEPKVVEIAAVNNPGVAVNQMEEGRERDSAYFRQELERTIEELEGLCVKWEQEQEVHMESMTEVAQEQLLLATGMARLIIREKFAQFRGLIEDCENPQSGTNTLCSDLQGFWDMLGIQVEDIHKKFECLSNMKENNWLPQVSTAPVKTAPKKGLVAKPKPVVAKGRSKFKAFLQAARKNAAGGQAPPPSPMKKSPNRRVQMTPKTARPSTSCEAQQQQRTPVPKIAQSGRASVTRTSTVESLNVSVSNKVESPNMRAIWSATRIAKSAGRKSFSLNDSASGLVVPSTSASTTVVPCLTRKPSQIPELLPGPSTSSGRGHTPLRGILKRRTAPQSSQIKKEVIFDAKADILPEEEDDVLSTPIPPVKHTYGHSTSPVLMSPLKDKFDELLLSDSMDHSKVVPENSATPRMETSIELPHSKFVKKPPTPHTRKGRRSGRFEPLTQEQLDAFSKSEEPGPSTSTDLFASPPPKSRQGRKSKSLGIGSPMVSGVASDLISWDSPQPQAKSKLRRSSRIQPSLLDE